MTDFGAVSRFRPDGPSLATRLGASRFNRGEECKPYRPHNPAKHAQLVALVHSGLTHREIATIYGGTPHGVRANLRRLRERGVL